MQDILCIFISRDNTRNNHVNRERKYIYIYSTWYETILIDTDIKHDTCCSNNLLQICWHNIKQDCYHAWSVLLNSIVHAFWFICPEQCCSNSPEQHYVQHVSPAVWRLWVPLGNSDIFLSKNSSKNVIITTLLTTMFTGFSTTLFTPVNNLRVWSVEPAVNLLSNNLQKFAKIWKLQNIEHLRKRIAL